MFLHCRWSAFKQFVEPALKATLAARRVFHRGAARRKQEKAKMDVVAVAEKLCAAWTSLDAKAVSSARGPSFLHNDVRNWSSRHIALPHKLGRHRGKADIAIMASRHWVFGYTAYNRQVEAKMSVQGSRRAML
jgi:hypothetical protein